MNLLTLIGFFIVVQSVLVFLENMLMVMKFKKGFMILLVEEKTQDGLINK